MKSALTCCYTTVSATGCHSFLLLTSIGVYGRGAPGAHEYVTVAQEKSMRNNWNVLTEPFNMVKDKEQRRLSHLMAGSLVIVFLLNLLLFVVRLTVDASSQLELIAWVAITILLASMYALARRGLYREAAWLAAVFCTLLLFALAFVQEVEVALQTLNYLTTIVIFSSLFLSWSMIILIAVTHLTGLLALPILAPAIPLEGMLTGPFSLNLTLALFILLVMRYRKVLEVASRADLEESEANLQKAQEIAQLGSYYWDARTGEVRWSDTLKTILGCEGDEEPDDDLFLSRIHPEDRERVTELGARTREKLGKLNLEYRILQPNGSVRHVRDVADFEYDAAGTPLRMFGVTLDITAQKEAQAARRESEERYRVLVEAAPVGVSVLQDGHYVFTNSAGAKMLGYDRPQDANGLPALDIIAPEYIEIVEQRVASLAQGKPNPPAEIELVGSDGTRVLVESISVPIRYRGAPAALLIGQNISDRKEAERALRESEASLRSILTAAPIGIGLVANREILQVNDRFCQITGYAPDELIGQNARMLYLSDEEYDYVGSDKYAQIDVGGTGTVETRWRRKDEQIIDILLSSTPLDPDDLSAGVTFTALDITQRKQAAEALRMSEEKFRNLVEHLPVGITITTPEGAILEANPATIAMLGYELKDEFIKTSAVEHWADPAKRDVYFNAVSDGVVRDFETQFRRKDGTPVWISLYSIFQFVEDGSQQILTALHDITRRKETEAELHQYRDQLEGLVEERTQSLSEANKQLKILSRVKDEFVANVSHELRTPIASLKLRTFLLEKNPVDLPKYLPSMQREANRLYRTIEDLLQLSTLDQGQVPLTMRALDLNLTLAQFVSDRMLLVSEDNHTLIFNNDEILPLVMGDEGLIVQVVSNLVSNALNYTPPGGSVSIITKIANHEGRTWAGFCVSDTGPGISPKEQKHIFARFFRGTSAKKASKPGTGLGLAISKEIIDRHEGQITVESSGIPGEGTTIAVWLPALLKDGNPEPQTLK